MDNFAKLVLCKRLTVYIYTAQQICALNGYYFIYLIMLLLPVWYMLPWQLDIMRYNFIGLVLSNQQLRAESLPNQHPLCHTDAVQSCSCCTNLLCCMLSGIINPLRTCTAWVTVVRSVCLPVCYSTSHFSSVRLSHKGYHLLNAQ